MNIRASYYYQVAEHKKSIINYYIIFIAAILFLFITMGVDIKSDDSITYSQIGGTGMATMIFLFVTGLCGFKETFGMLMQNGISRKSLFCGRISTSLMIAVVMAFIDEILSVIFKGITSLVGENFIYSSLYEQIYYSKVNEMGAVRLHVESFILDFFLFLGAIALGYVIALTFYRMNKTGKAALGAGLPIGLFIVLPFFDSLVTNGKITTTIMKLIDSAFGFTSQQPLNAMLTGGISFVVLSGLSWLLIRRANIKE